MHLSALQLCMSVGMELDVFSSCFYWDIYFLMESVPSLLHGSEIPDFYFSTFSAMQSLLPPLKTVTHLAACHVWLWIWLAVLVSDSFMNSFLRHWIYLPTIYVIIRRLCPELDRYFIEPLLNYYSLNARPSFALPLFPIKTLEFPNHPSEWHSIIILPAYTLFSLH